MLLLAVLQVEQVLLTLI